MTQLLERDKVRDAYQSLESVARTRPTDEVTEYVKENIDWLMGPNGNGGLFEDYVSNIIALTTQEAYKEYVVAGLKGQEDDLVPAHFVEAARQEGIVLTLIKVRNLLNALENVAIHAFVAGLHVTKALVEARDLPPYGDS